MSDTATAAALARPAAYRDRGQAAPASLFLAPATLLVLVMSCLDFGLVSNPCRRRHLALGVRYQQRSA